MSNFQGVETQKLIFGTTASFATFGEVGGGGGIQQCYLSCDADCFVDFDTPAVTTRSLLLKANLAPVRIDFHGVSVQKVYAIGNGTGNLYILGVRN